MHISNFNVRCNILSIRDLGQTWSDKQPDRQTDRQTKINSASTCPDITSLHVEWQPFILMKTFIRRECRQAKNTKKTNRQTDRVHYPQNTHKIQFTELTDSPNHL